MRFSNGSEVRKELLADTNGKLVKRLLAIEDIDKRVGTAIWSVLSRSPDPDEKKILASYLTERKDRLADATRQMVWSLLTSTEMRFNY